MKLNFPNPSRSYDAVKNRIRFWGYDSAIEVSFFVEVDALLRLCPEMNGAEKECLKAFDSVLNQIHKAANKAYVEGGKAKGSYAYVLAANDF